MYHALRISLGRCAPPCSPLWGAYDTTPPDCVSVYHRPQSRFVVPASCSPRQPGHSACESAWALRSCAVSAASRPFAWLFLAPRCISVLDYILTLPLRQFATYACKLRLSHACKRLLLNALCSFVERDVSSPVVRDWFE